MFDILSASKKPDKPVDSLSLKELAVLATDEWNKTTRENKLLRVALDLCPWPMWLKRLEQWGGKPAFRMLWINRAYVKRWGISKSDYEGHFDYEVWGEEVGRQFAKNDLLAVSVSPKPLYTEERVPDLTVEGPSGRARIPSRPLLEEPLWKVGKVSAQDGLERFVFGVAWRPDQPVSTDLGESSLDLEGIE